METEAWLRAYFQRVLARGAYGPGLIRMFATTDDGRTTEKDVLNNLMMLLAAGTETTGLAIGNVVACLLREESRYERLRADPGLVPAVINESLRLEPPLHFVTRFTTGPLALRDATIPAGAAVQICLGSANRDETQFERPDEWDPTRPGLQWDGKKWSGDVPDYKVDASPGSYGAFIMLREGVAKLFAADFAEGPAV